MHHGLGQGWSAGPRPPPFLPLGGAVQGKAELPEHCTSGKEKPEEKGRGEGSALAAWKRLDREVPGPRSSRTPPLPCSLRMSLNGQAIPVTLLTPFHAMLFHLFPGGHLNHLCGDAGSLETQHCLPWPVQQHCLHSGPLPAPEMGTALIII